MNGTRLTASLIAVCECIDGTSWRVWTVERFVVRWVSSARPVARDSAGCAPSRVADRRQVRRRLDRNRTAGRRNVSTVFYVHFWPMACVMMIFVAILTRSGPSSLRWLYARLVVGNRGRLGAVYRAADTDANSYIVAVKLVIVVNKSSDLSACGLPNVLLYYRSFLVYAPWPGKSRWTPVVGHAGHPQLADGLLNIPSKYDIPTTYERRPVTITSHIFHDCWPQPVRSSSSPTPWFRR